MVGLSDALAVEVLAIYILTCSISVHFIVYTEILTEDFEDKKKLYLDKDYVILTSKEQLVYYEIFRERFGKPPLIH